MLLNACCAVAVRRDVRMRRRSLQSGSAYHIGMSTTESNVIDPVCGMTVSTQSPHHSEFEGTTYYFCCGGCLSKFRDDPKGTLDRQSDPVSLVSITVGKPSCCHKSLKRALNFLILKRRSERRFLGVFICSAASVLICTC
ncbi:MAG: YHS domain-containing protein, partial [Planctomycetota bacterium]